MDKTLFSQAETFIWNNARLLERHLFACLFCEGAIEPVIAALKAYQNPDGGLGNALEPDNRCPGSQPIFIEFALIELDMVNALSNPQVQADLLLPACDFLQSVTTEEGGVPFVLPSANPYQHTPWMGAPDHPPAALNPTASLAGLLLKAGIRHPWLEQASDFCWRKIPASQAEGFHDLMPVITFLTNSPDQQRAAPELERIAHLIQKPGMVEYNPDAGGYVKMPLDWAPTPDSFCFSLFEKETLRAHLAALARRQQTDGGWPITWDPISPVDGWEYRGRFTIDALVTLRAYEAKGYKIDF